MEIRAIAKGRVQGVFFRSFVEQLANSMRLRGYVGNLDNGDVEIVANGSADMIAEFLEVIKAKKEDFGIYVESLSWEETGEHEYPGFEKM
jgi:acylphosphatase